MDELHQIEKEPVMVYDGFRKEYFRLRVAIILHVHDFPGQAKVFHGQGSGGKHACPMCRAEGMSQCKFHTLIVDAFQTAIINVMR